MVATLTNGEEAQLLQTIEMFEVITQSQPQDVQSLEILKEAYAKLGRETELIAASKRIAQAYMTMGQISSAILEYEGILQRFPDDAEALAALGEIESKAGSLGPGSEGDTVRVDLDPGHTGRLVAKSRRAARKAPPTEFDDGRQALHKIFVEGKVISNAEFEKNWVTPDLSKPSAEVIEPFVQVLAEHGLIALEKALHIISDKGRFGFLPLEKYEIDIELARSFPKETLFRWCILPFDRMSKSILVATTNPFNKQAAYELEEHTEQRLIWYLAPPAEIAKALRKIIR